MPGKLKEYDDILKSQLDNGIIERVEPDEIDVDRVHYLPHKPVLREHSSSTPLRIVFDASSKTTNKDASLNDCLLTDP